MSIAVSVLTTSCVARNIDVHWDGAARRKTVRSRQIYSFETLLVILILPT
jgi:hypothetical protein